MNSKSALDGADDTAKTIQHDRSEIETAVPSTTFEQFSKLPNEIQIIIIEFAHLSPRIVDVRWPRVYIARISFGYRQKIANGPRANVPALLQVSKLFRVPGEKIRPPSFVMKGQHDITYEARVRFNFDIDTIVFPSIYLQDHTKCNDLEKVQRLVLSSDDHAPGGYLVETCLHIHGNMKMVDGGMKLIPRATWERCRSLNGHNPDVGYVSIFNHLSIRGLFSREWAAVKDWQHAMSCLDSFQGRWNPQDLWLPR